MILNSGEEESAHKLILRIAENDDFNCPIPDYVDDPPDDGDGEKLELFDRDRFNGWIESVDRRVRSLTDGIKWREQGDLNGAHVQILADEGALFIVSKYEHSGVRYYIAGSASYECNWDTTRLAGVYLLPGYALTQHKTYEERFKFAKQRIAAFSAWSDGSVYEWILEDDSGDFIGSSYVVIDSYDKHQELTKDLLEAAIDVLKHNGLADAFLTDEISLEIDQELGSVYKSQEFIPGIKTALAAAKTASSEVTNVAVKPG